MNELYYSKLNFFVQNFQLYQIFRISTMFVSVAYLGFHFGGGGSD